MPVTSSSKAVTVTADGLECPHCHGKEFYERADTTMNRQVLGFISGVLHVDMEATPDDQEYDERLQCSGCSETFEYPEEIRIEYNSEQAFGELQGGEDNDAEKE